MPLDPDQSEDGGIQDEGSTIANVYVSFAPTGFDSPAGEEKLAAKPRGKDTGDLLEVLSVKRQDWLAVLGLSR